MSLLSEIRNELASARESLICWSDNVVNPSMPDGFIARDRFKKDSAEVIFAGFDFYFCQYFLSGEENIDDSVNCRGLRSGHLSRPVYLQYILGLLGDRVPNISLKELFWLLSQQPSGECGELDSSGTINVMFANDIRQVMRPVRIAWLNSGDHYGWALFASRFCNSLAAGSKVFMPAHAAY